MTGDRAYEFAAAGLFLPRGDPRLLGRLLAAYGRSFDPRELLAYTLLHLHANLPECLTEFPARPSPPWIPWPRPGSAPPRPVPIHLASSRLGQISMHRDGGGSGLGFCG
jgi:hypothetical protein